MNWKIWLLITALIFASLAIAPWKSFEKGVMIESVEKNTTEFSQGLRAGMIIKQINSIAINNLADYSRVVLDMDFSTSNSTKIIVLTDKQQFVFIKDTPLNITVGEIPGSNIKTGLDLSGGARALIKPANVSLSSSEISDLIAITNERFNVYGLKDITIKPVIDLQGNNYMLIEIAGATPSDLETLISHQGKFEGRIGNQTVFIGGEDIAHVERSGQNSGIEGCFPAQGGGEFCRFRFGITLTEEAATRQAEITKNLSISSENPEYLSEKLSLYVDDNPVDSLYISKDLKGRVIVDISILSQDSRIYPRSVYSALASLRERVDLIIENIGELLRYYQFKLHRNPVERLVITGRLSHDKAFMDGIKNSVDIPIDAWDPLADVTLSKPLSKDEKDLLGPMAVASLSLAMRNA